MGDGEGSSRQGPCPCQGLEEGSPGQAREKSLLLGFVDDDLVQEDNIWEANNPSNNTFITGFCIRAGTLEHWKPSNTDFCSHLGNLEYYNTFITGFWIFIYPGQTEPQLNINVNFNVLERERVGKGIPQLEKQACYLTVNIYKKV